VFLPLPVLFFPAFCNFGLVKAGLWPKSAKAGKLLEFGLCITSLAIALPASIALFKSRASLPVEECEEKFWDLKTDDGKKVTHVYFNKGM
jgi:hypothetical protein